MPRKRYKGVLYPTARKDTTRAWRPTNIKYLRHSRNQAKLAHQSKRLTPKTKRKVVSAYRKEKIEARYQLKQDRGRRKR